MKQAGAGKHLVQTNSLVTPELLLWGHSHRYRLRGETEGLTCYAVTREYTPKPLKRC